MDLTIISWWIYHLKKNGASHHPKALDVAKTPKNDSGPEISWDEWMEFWGDPATKHVKTHRIHGAGIYTNIKGVFLDGIHGAPYIAAPWIRHGRGRVLGSFFGRVLEEFLDRFCWILFGFFVSPRNLDRDDSATMATRQVKNYAEWLGLDPKDRYSRLDSRLPEL